MLQEERLSYIMQIFESGEDVDAFAVMNVLNIDTSTLTKDFRELLDRGDIVRSAPGAYRKSFNIRKYLRQPAQMRDKKQYNPDFLAEYVPNETFLLGEENIKRIDEYYHNFLPLNYTFRANLDVIEKLFIDLSHNSTRLSGGNMDRLDCEILVKYGIKASSPLHDNLCVLNHKNLSEEFILNKDYKELGFSQIAKFHKLLAKSDANSYELGIIRDSYHEIIFSRYQALTNKIQMEKELDIFLYKLEKISHPFERSFFMLVFISYLCVFFTDNEELARVCSNYPLIKAGRYPQLFLDVDREENELALAALYEFCDVSFLRDIYIDSYFKSLDSYASTQKTLS